MAYATPPGAGYYPYWNVGYPLAPAYPVSQQAPKPPVPVYPALLPMDPPREAEPPARLNILEAAPLLPPKPAKATTNGIQALQIIKIVYSGLAGCISAVLLFGVPIKVAFTAELVMSVLGSILAKKIYQAKSPWADKVMAFTNRMIGGPNKPISQLSPKEKDRSLAPISAGVTMLSSLLVATGNYLYLKFTKSGPPVMPSIEKLMRNFRNSTGLLNKAFYGLRVVGAKISNFGPMKWVHQHPALIFPFAIISGLVWGLMEGFAAQGVSEHERKIAALR
jgi:hypothetical protein